VDDPSKGFPRSSDGKDTPIVLWPFKLSELGPVGYLKVPAFPFEPIFGEVWRYDFTQDLKALGFDVSQLRTAANVAPAPAPADEATADVAPAPAPAGDAAHEEEAETTAEAPASEA
jgi:hypothetical protein